MHFDLEEIVCRCGSQSFYQHCQEYTEDGRWITRAERLAYPETKLASCYPAVAVSDSTWFTCNSCKHDIDAETANSLLKKVWLKPGPKFFTEVIGDVIISPRVVK
jgi:hypothetical protein